MAGNTDIVQVYKRVASIIWQRLSPTFGIRTINAIGKNTLARCSREHPYLANLKVGADGLEWAQFEQHLGEVEEDTITAMLDRFMDEFFEGVAILIGRLVIGKIFAEAEQEIEKERKE